MTVPTNETAAPTRRTFLESVFGRDKAQAVKSDLSTAQVALDELGVARKELGETAKEQVVLEIAAPSETPAETPAPAQEQEAGEQPPEALAVASAITEIIMGAAAQDSTVLTSADRMAEVIAGAIRPSESSEEAAPGESTPPSDEEKPEMKALVKSWQAQQDFIMSATKDMGEIADAFNTQQSEIAALKSLVAKLPDIEKELAELRSQVGGRPRIASQASETVLDPTSKQAQAMEKSIREGTEGESKFFSIPVKNTPK